MTTEYIFRDQSGMARLDGTLEPDPAANSVPTGWAEDGANPANVTSNGGALTLAGGPLTAELLALSGLTGAVSATRYVGGTATVAPTTGTFAQGDWVVSLNGSAWVCTVAGTPGTWVELGSVLLAPKASPTFTGTVTVPAPAAATDATTKTYVDTANALKAPLASPTFTGVPAAPTAAGGTNSTQLATTAFVATSFAPLASPTFTGTVAVPAAAAVTSAPRLNQLTSALTITSGTLPNTGAWASGTAKVNPVSRDITVNVVVVTDGTANVATCTIDVSPDNSTFTTIGVPGASAAVNTVGAVTILTPVSLPAGWFIKVTLVHCTVAASIYF